MEISNSKWAVVNLIDLLQCFKSSMLYDFLIALEYLPTKSPVSINVLGAFVRIYFWLHALLHPCAHYIFAWGFQEFLKSAHLVTTKFLLSIII